MAADDFQDRLARFKQEWHPTLQTTTQAYLPNGFAGPFLPNATVIDLEQFLTWLNTVREALRVLAFSVPDEASKCAETCRRDAYLLLESLNETGFPRETSNSENLEVAMDRLGLLRDWTVAKLADGESPQSLRVPISDSKPATDAEQQPASGAVPQTSSHTQNRTPTKAQALAGRSFEFAQQKCEGELIDPKAYEWLNGHGTSDAESELENYKLPSFDTWSRQLRAWRKLTGNSKNHSRKGRARFGSVVRSDQIEMDRE